jgi:small-conductance mechanosensitive channel
LDEGNHSKTKGLARSATPVGLPTFFSPFASNPREFIFLHRELILTNWRNTLLALGVALGAVALALLAHLLLFWLLKRVTKNHGSLFYDRLRKHEAAPMRLLLPVLALMTVLPWIPVDPGIAAHLTHATSLLLIACVAWSLVALLDVLQDFISHRQALELADNLAARRMNTQVQVLRHIAVVLIVVLSIAIMVMTFPNVRHVGESLFASAGLAALVAGLAARTTLSSLLAGVQIALSQPMRLEDAVVIEGEWGWVEEITMTYVVVRIWDLRRLIVPLSYFIEKPFQNWTRQTADLLGTVFIYADYTLPIEPVRQELQRILQSTKLWDGRVWNLQVTNAKENVIELRALMSASNGSVAWDLRCFVREKLVDFIQQKYPASLPRTRADVSGMRQDHADPRDGDHNSAGKIASKSLTAAFGPSS